MRTFAGVFTSLRKSIRTAASFTRTLLQKMPLPARVGVTAVLLLAVAAGVILPQMAGSNASAENTDVQAAIELHLKEQQQKRAAHREELNKKVAEAEKKIDKQRKIEAEKKKREEEAKRKAEEEAARGSGPSASAPHIPASCNEYSGNRATGCAILLQKGFGLDQMGCLNSLWTKESQWNHTARNPSSGAYGIPQSLPASKMASHGADWQTNPVTQIRWGLDYIKNRYGTPCSAWSHSQATDWY